MALNPPKAIETGELINNANETVYTCPSAVKTLISAATAHNTTATAATLTVWVGASATDAFKRFNQSIAGNDTVDLAGVIGQSLDAGELIIAVSGTANVISVRITGSEFAVV